MSKLYDLLNSIISKVKATEKAIPKKLSELNQDVPYVKTVNGNNPDKNNNVEIDIPEETVNYTKQNLTDDQKSQARTNIGVEEAAMSLLIDMGVAPVLLTDDGTILTDNDGAILINA